MEEGLDLETLFTFKKWKLFIQATLGTLILFNRRRSGEVARLRLPDFYAATGSEIDKDVAATLSPLELNLVKIFKRVQTEGKTMAVPIILTPLHQKCLDVLVKCR